jgi:hypothetical protein
LTAGSGDFALVRYSAGGVFDTTFGAAAAGSSNLSNGDFAVARFDVNGVLDASFDGDGRFTVDFFGSFDGAENVLVQPDGKIVLGGFAANGLQERFAIARITP